ncbi:MAG: hypothetical protein ACKOXB_02360 [Flavobacteriales bacterium]
MKNSLLIKSFAAALLICTSLFTASCESDRDDEDDTYSSMDEFYNKHRQEEQEFVIDSAGGGPIIGKQKTQLYLDSSIFMFPGGGDVSYPITIKLIELYPQSDFMEYPMSTVADGEVTVSAGAIRVRAYKNGTELVLKPGKCYAAVMPDTNNLLNDMKVFYGDNKDTDVNWSEAKDASKVLTQSGYYALSVYQMGWINNAKLHSKSGSATQITFKAKGSGTEFIDVYIVAKDYFSVVKVSKLKSIEVPEGENVTIIAMAMDQDKKYRLHNTSVTVTKNMAIELDLKVVTEQDVLNTLGAL